MPASAPSDPSDVSEVIGRGPRGRRARFLLALAVLASAGLTALIWGLGHGARDQVARFKTQAASRGDLAVRVTATGTLQPVNQVDVGT